MDYEEKIAQQDWDDGIRERAEYKLGMRPFVGFDIRKADISDVSFDGEGEIDDVNFLSCNLEGAAIDCGNVSNAGFMNCNMKHCNVRGTFFRCEVESDLSFSDLSRTTWVNSEFGERCQFAGTNLEGARFIDCHFDFNPACIKAFDDVEWCSGNYALGYEIG